MRKPLLTALLSLFVLIGLQAQPTKGTTKKKVKKTTKTTTVTKAIWSKGGNFSLALSQGGSKNWVPGADKFTLSGNAFLYVYANQTKGRYHFDNWADINYGMQTSENFGPIKNDDKLELCSRWSREIGKHADKRYWRYSVFTNFRTQFTDGYFYENGNRTRVSAFMAPAVFLVSPGVSYDYNKHFSLHVSPFTPRWVVVANRPNELAAKYDVKSTQQVRIEGGAMASASLNFNLIKNVNIRSRVDAFSDYLNNKPGNVDVYWTNTVYLSVNKYLGVVYNFDLQYDDNTRIFGVNKTSPGTQLKSLFGVGLNVKF